MNNKKSWLQDDDNLLDNMYNEDMLDIMEISEQMDRSPGEIISRLVKLEFITNRTSARGYILYKNSDIYKEIVSKGKMKIKKPVPDINSEILTDKFKNDVKLWIDTDNQLKEYNEHIKELRQKRNELESSITRHITENNISDSAIELSGTRLKYTETKVSESLTFKYLERVLKEIKSDEEVESLMEYIRNKREIKIIPEIKRYLSK